MSGPTSRPTHPTRPPPEQRETVLRELDAIGCGDTPIVELWNKIDNMGDSEAAEMARIEAACVPVEVDAVVVAGGEEEEEEEGVGRGLPEAAAVVAGPAGGEEEDGEGGYVAALPDGGFDTPSSSSSSSLTHADASPSPPPTPPKKARKTPPSRTVLRAPRKTFTVAASVKSGLGFDDFLGALEAALSLRLKVHCPYLAPHYLAP